jgi:hypothetical protein
MRGSATLSESHELLFLIRAGVWFRNIELKSLEE